MSHFRKSFLSFFIVFLLSAPLFQTLHAAEPWAIYLFNDENQEVLKIYEDGATETYPIALEAGERVFSILASPYVPDMVAYCTVKTLEDSASEAYEISYKLHHLASDEILSHTTIWDTDTCQVESFSPDGTLVVFHHYISRYESREELLPTWTILVMDSATGEIQAELSPQSPAINEDISALIFDADEQLIGLHPSAFFIENQLFFTLDEVFMTPDGLHEVFAAHAFEWDFEANQLSLAENLWRDSSAYLSSTGELVITDRDNGAVFIRDAEQNEQLLFQDSEWQAITAFFLNNGQLLGIFLSPPRNSSDVTIRYVFLDRARNQAEISFPNGSFGQPYSAPNGVALLIMESQASGTVYRLEILNLENNESQIIWEDESDVFWYGIGTINNPEAENLEPFPNP